MQDSDNEFSLDLFTDYRTDTPSDPIYRIEGAVPIIMDSAGWTVNFHYKTITVEKPIKFIDLYSGLMDMMDDTTLMDYTSPVIAITENLFELINGWSFKNDSSRKNIREAGWSEGNEQWVCIQPIGCCGEITNLMYKWDYELGGNFSKFEHISTLTSEDSGLISEPIKVEGTPKQLSINVNGMNDWRDIESLTGITNFTCNASIVVIAVGWFPPAPIINTEPNRPKFSMGPCLDGEDIIWYTWV